MDRRSQSIEEYLEAMFKLSLSPSGITVGRLATELGVAPSSVSEMVARLEAAELERTPGGQWNSPRPAGTKAPRWSAGTGSASASWSTCWPCPGTRCTTRPASSSTCSAPDVEARLAERLGNPATCPHGYAIPDENGELAEAVAQPLADLQTGERGVIAHVDEADPELLRYLASLGLMPNAGRHRERGAVRRPAVGARGQRPVCTGPRGGGPRVRAGLTHS